MLLLFSWGTDVLALYYYHQLPDLYMASQSITKRKKIIREEVIIKHFHTFTSHGAVQNQSPTSATWVGLYWVETWEHRTLVQGLCKFLNCSQMLMTHVFLDLKQQKTYVGKQHDNKICKLRNGYIQCMKLHKTHILDTLNLSNQIDVLQRNIIKSILQKNKIVMKRHQLDRF